MDAKNKVVFDREREDECRGYVYENYICIQI